MKKNRNSFFTETNIQSGMMPYPNQQPMPYQQANSYLYQGPTNPYNYNTQNNDLESQINRLEHRISALENNTNILSSEDYESINTNMYMV